MYDNYFSIIHVFVTALDGFLLDGVKLQRSVMSGELLLNELAQYMYMSDVRSTETLTVQADDYTFLTFGPHSLAVLHITVFSMLQERKIM